MLKRIVALKNVELELEAFMAHEDWPSICEQESAIESAVQHLARGCEGGRLPPAGERAWNEFHKSTHRQPTQRAAVEQAGTVFLQWIKEAARSVAADALKAEPTQAQQLCCQVLEAGPKNFRGLHLLGVLTHQAGNSDAGLRFILAAIRLQPDFAEALCDLGNVHRDRGNLDEAIASYERALGAKPNFAEAHNNLGAAFKERGKLAEAANCLRRAVELKPNYVDAYNNLGNVLTNQGKLDEAVQCYQRALLIEPGSDSAEALNNLGVVFLKQGRRTEATACLRRALALRPNHADAHNNLGNALTLGKRDADDVSWQEVEASYREAIRLKPTHVEARKNLANALHQQHKFREAEDQYREAMRLKPDFAEAHAEHAIFLLQQGDFEHGWPEYEWRWRTKLLGPYHRKFPQPLWDGRPLPGGTILLHTEQGFGDAIQFVRYAALVKERVGRVVCDCASQLVRLFRTCPGIDEVVAVGADLPAFDVHAPLLSLPRILGTTATTVPSRVPYLAADAELAKHWQQALSAFPGFKIGIVWQGNPRQWNPELKAADRLRSAALAQFERIARLAADGAGGEPVRLISLQKGFGVEQIAQQSFPVVDLGGKLNDFMDTAAVMANLDLVITVDSSPAHLAGALGVPVWVAIPFFPDWRWLLGREDSPWYPTMRLFRQAQWGAWDHVFERFAAEVRKLRKGRSSRSDAASSVEQWLKQAVRHHQAGEAAQAERLYRQVLDAAPKNVHALHLLGVLTHQAGHTEMGLRCIIEALRLRPDFAEAHCDLGNVYRDLGKLAEAVASYETAMRLKPSSAEAHNNLGAALKEQGKLAEAAECLRRAVTLKPDYADAHNNLGNVLRNQGKLDEAVRCYQQALAHDEDLAEAHSNLGIVYHDQGKWDEAVASYQRAVRLKPSLAEAHSNLGALLRDAGRLEEAATCYRQVLSRKPNSAEAHNNLGIVCKELGQPEEAMLCYRRALALNPDFAEAHGNLGVVRAEQGKLDEAVVSYRQALKLNPDSAGSHSNLGCALREQGKWDEALASLRRAIALQPGYADAHMNLGMVCKDLGRLDEAIAHYREALRLKPNSAEAHNNLGNALREQGEWKEAIASYERALALKPEYAQAHTNLGINLLHLGDFQNGWREYEWRWAARMLRPHRRSFAQPLWQGETLPEGTILLHAEQGFGDAIQFVRYAPLVKERMGRVLCECRPELVRLFGTCPGIDEVIATGMPLPAFQVHAPLLSLPGILGTTPATIPNAVPYLVADAELAKSWKQELSAMPGPKIGIAWQGSPRPWNPQLQAADQIRSFPLALFERVARAVEVQLISLQKGFGAEQIAEVRDRFSVVDLGGRLNDFMDTAALMTNLDLVISVDSSPAHLAGALGVPVWVALPAVSCWRWLLDRADSPWYPTMRLFRQTERGNWNDVFQRIAATLLENYSARGKG